MIQICTNRLFCCHYIPKADYENDRIYQAVIARAHFSIFLSVLSKGREFASLKMSWSWEGIENVLEN